MYDVKSVHATEFIDNNEVLNTVKYAQDNKNNAELIDKILEKAKEEKGLTHKEASVLLACEIPEKNEEIFALAKKLNLNTTETELFFLLRCIYQTIV